MEPILADRSKLMAKGLVEVLDDLLVALHDACSSIRMKS